MSGQSPSTAYPLSSLVYSNYENALDRQREDEEEQSQTAVASGAGCGAGILARDERIQGRD